MNCQLFQLGSRQLELRYISFLWFPHIILSQFYSLIILAQNVQKPFQSFSNTVFINLFHSIASFIRIRVFSQIVFGYSCLQWSSSLHLWVLRHCTVRLDDGNGWRDLPVICKTVMNIMSNCHNHGKKLFHQGVFLKAKWYKIRVGKASDLPHDHQSSGRLSEFRKWRLPNDADRISPILYNN